MVVYLSNIFLNIKMNIMNTFIKYFIKFINKNNNFYINHIIFLPKYIIIFYIRELMFYYLYNDK